MTATTTAPRSRDWLTLLPFLLAVTTVAVVGGLAAGSAGDTYSDLTLPSFAPPSWLFGPVWSLLYLMIAVAGWLLWRARGRDVALGVWVAQLLLNLAWTPLFFAANRYTLALADIVLLAVVILGLIVLASRRSRAAAWLLVPYAVWVLFATALNTAIVVLN